MIEYGLEPIVNLTMDYIAEVDPSQPSGFSSKHGPTEGTAILSFRGSFC